jgi:thiamine-phosphate diphosphorylase
MSLPSHYLITPSVGNEAEFLEALECSLQAGICLMQLKGKGMEGKAYAVLAEKVIKLAHGYNGKVLLTGNPSLVEQLGADGLHLDSKALKSTICRPLADKYMIAISGHTLDALKQGEVINASFAVVSPIKYTKAHPDIEPIGWQGLKEITAQVNLPVYALGGVSAEDETAAINAGAQGVAGNRGYWKD